jgi:hypothetical protein
VIASLPSPALAETSAEFRLEGPGPATISGSQGKQIGILLPFGEGGPEYPCEPPPFTTQSPKGEQVGEATLFSSFTSEGEESGVCYLEGKAVPLEMNGCQFTFQPGEPVNPTWSSGTISLGPEGCGPIRTESILYCKVGLTPNSWEQQVVQYQDVGSGPEETIQVLAELLDLSAKLEGPYWCAQSYKGNWTISWELSAEDEQFKPRGLAVIDPEAGGAPGVTTEAASAVKAASATLNATINPKGLSTTYQFEYGTTTEYGSTAPVNPTFAGAGSKDVSVAQPLGGLAEETLYHYRVVAENSAGTSYGEDRTFATLRLPEAATEGTSELRAYGARLNGTVNPQGSETTYRFQYGTRESYGETTGSASAGSGTSSVGVVGFTCCVLEPETTYHYRLVTESQAGTAYGEDETFTTEAAPKTSFTSPTPSYTGGEKPPIEFASSKSGSTFQCSLDEAQWQACESPYELPKGLGPEDWHHFKVYATDAQGNQDRTPAEWTFKLSAYPAAPSTSKLVYPEEGKKTASYYTLKAEWGTPPKEGGGVSGVSFQVQLPGWDTFKQVPADCVIDDKGNQVSWPLATSASPGHTEPVFLKVKGCPPFEEAGYPETDIKFRAVFDGGPNAAGASEPVATEFIDYYNEKRASTDASETIGPGSLDLLTGDYTISRTDVSIPVPGTEANLEFSRIYDSTIENNLPGYSFVLGGWWQPSTPVEAEYEGEAWTSLKERVIPYRPAVHEKECWNEEGETTSCGEGCPPEYCEEWLAEEEQPEERWMELLDNEGSGIPFEISGTGESATYIAPDYAKELKLTREDSEHIVLADPDGTHTTFTLKGGREYLPKEVSFQATPHSVRMVYEPVGNYEKRRLMREIAPAPEGVTCGDWTSIETPGCRTLAFEYQPSSKWGGEGWSDFVNLASIRYYNASGNKETSQKVAEYNYDSELDLIEEWDPRLPKLKEQYAYREGSFSNLMTSLRPAGEEPWELDYYIHQNVNGEWERPLKSVSRASLLESDPTATTTIAYEVPVSGEGAPYEMSAAAVAGWGQSDLPVDATAIFPPNHVPGSYPPSDYSGATVHYMDPDGYEINTASPAPPGVEGDSITTSETDTHGNVVRELSARNRLAALEAEDPVVRSQELDTHSAYSTDGTELLESWGRCTR